MSPVKVGVTLPAFGVDGTADAASHARHAEEVDGEEVTLAPGATMPPVLIGGGPATLRRAGRYGDEWYPAFSSPKKIVAAARKPAELAHE